jgi:predicted nucleic-acid-binding protein
LVLIDTNILDCLSEAMTHGDFPRTHDDALRAQQIASFRLYLWTGNLSVGRVAVEELKKTPDATKREWLEGIVGTQLGELRVQADDKARWEARVKELENHHKGYLDCRLVAEAEMFDGVTALISFDKRMVRKLRPHAKVDLMFPTEYWDVLAIPRGTPPKWKPAESNPLSAATFWRWE